MSNIAGIDFGTTFSAIAILNEIGRPEIVPTGDDGSRILPSAVYFKPDGSGCLVGEGAVNSRKEHGCYDNCVRWIKKEMGEAEYSVSIMNDSYSPSEISAMIIRKLVEGASSNVGEIKDVVISIPANYGETARKATMDAAGVAGLNVVGIVNEPTAAALYYASSQDVSGKVMIFDLGGGTFDVTLGTISGKELDVVASCGDKNLGGYNFDSKLTEHFISRYREETGSELIEFKEDRATIEDYAEEMKIALSKKDSVNVQLRGDAGRFRFALSRSDFEEIISTDVAKMEMLIETVLDEANWSEEDVEQVLLAGGSSRIPAVRTMLKRLFGKEPCSANVDECVALGAAIYSGLRLQEQAPEKVSAGVASGLRDIRVCEVANHAYGTISIGVDEVAETLEKRNTILIRKNTPIPCEITEVFSTMTPNQGIINCKVTQASDNDAVDPDLVTILHKGQMKLPPNLPANEPIEVTFSYDKNQRMNCVFLHKASGEKHHVKIDIKKGNSRVKTVKDLKGKISSIIIE